MNTVSWSITDIFEYVIKYHNNMFTYSISSLTSSLQFVPPVGRTGLETQERLRSGVETLISHLPLEFRTRSSCFAITKATNNWNICL